MLRFESYRFLDENVFSLFERGLADLVMGVVWRDYVDREHFVVVQYLMVVLCSETYAVAFLCVLEVLLQKVRYPDSLL
jgi:hypothetical protein